MSKNINSIIEGCMSDTPERLSYCGIEIVIPENAQVLLSSHEIHPTRYLLFAKTKDFREFEILQNPNFDLSPNKLPSEGWPLIKFEPKFRWIFDAQRSLTTRDGRIFIETTYFAENWKWYLNAVPTVFQECGEIFSGRKAEDYFYKNPSRAW